MIGPLVYLTPIAATALALGIGALYCIRWCAGRDLLDATRPDAADVAAAEASLPHFGDTR